MDGRAVKLDRVGAYVNAAMKHRAPFQAFQLVIWHAPRHILHLQHHVHTTLARLCFFMPPDFDSMALKRPEATRPVLQCFCGLERKSTLQN